MIIKRNNIVCNNKITESNKLYAILICKIFNTADFKLWLNWYINFIKCDHIYIINDNSSIDIKALVKPFENKITLLNLNEIEEIENKSDLQTHTYNKIIFNYIKPNINDIIITPDSDEFWWYNYDKFTSFKKCISDEFDKINEETLLVANILMCNNYFLNSRSQEENFNDISKYRCNIVSAEHKPIIRFNNNKIIHFHLGTKSNHFLTNKHLWLANFYGSGVLYDYHLRLYHYRLTTIEEYNQKLINTLIKYEITNGKRFYMANDINDFMKKSYSNDNKEEDLKYNVLDLTINNTIQKFLK